MDIDEKTAEGHRRQAAQMRALAALFPALIHDIKSPLNAMVVNLELLRESLDPSGPQIERQRRYTGILKEELLRLNRTVEALLDEAAKPAVRPDRVDLAALVAEIGKMVAPKARQQKVTLELDTPAGQLPVQGYRDRLRQAVLQVAVNALQAMPDGGELGLAAAREDDRAVVRVTDTGPGVDAAVAEALFDLGVSTRGEGAGLGLAVARSVIESHGGTITYDSEEGRGARFELTLPLVS